LPVGEAQASLSRPGSMGCFQLQQRRMFDGLNAKFHGASVHVAEKITVGLKEDFEKVRKLK
jgi:hypothetical protein